MRISDWSSDVCSSDLQQLQSVAPNLMVYQSVGAAIPFLRGIGFSSGDPATESSVAMYVDGVYQPSVYAKLFEFNGIERIEVLKGPRGTLLGRSEEHTSERESHMRIAYAVCYWKQTIDRMTGNSVLRVRI